MAAMVDWGSGGGGGGSVGLLTGPRTKLAYRVALAWSRATWAKMSACFARWPCGAPGLAGAGGVAAAEESEGVPVGGGRGLRMPVCVL